MEKSSVSVAAATPRTYKAVLYLRVSTKEQARVGGEAEGYSIPAQRAACTAKAEAMGAIVVDEYVDAGASARSADRDALKSMLTRIEAERDVDVVLVHKVDRLARSRADDIESTLRLQAAGVTLVSCTESIDETPSGRLVHGIMASIAEFYSRNLATEVSKGLTQKAQSGGTPSKAPLGYLNHRVFVDGTEVRTVIVDDDRAPHVIWAFEEYATGTWTTRTLAAALDDRGLRTRGNKRYAPKPVAANKLAEILANPYYAGHVPFKGVLYAGKHPALISQELFDRVQDALAANNFAGEKQRTHRHYLRSTIVCAQCGSRLVYTVSTGRRGGRYPYFFCIGRNAKRTSCWQRALAVDFVESSVEAYWKLVAINPEKRERIKELLRSELLIQRGEVEGERQIQQSRIGRLTAERDKLLRAHYADAIPLELLKVEQDRIGKELRAAERSIELTTERFDEIESCVTAAVDLTDRLGDAYASASDSVRRLLNQALFVRVRVGPDGVAGADFTDGFRELLGGQLLAQLEVLAEARREGTYATKSPAQCGASADTAHVRGLNIELLVGAEGLEPPTSAL
jgi:site-specific DNA recombinase